MKFNIYKRNVELNSCYDLTNNDLERITGMLTKIVLNDNSVVEGYADPFRVEGKEE